MLEQGSDGAGNRRGRETRLQLLSAAWALIDELSFSDIVRLVPVKAITERAGRSEGAFRHHFSDSDDFARALVELPRPYGVFGGPDDRPSYNAVRAALSDFEPHEIIDVVRVAAATDYVATRVPEELTAARGELLLLTRLRSDPQLMPTVAEGVFRNLVPPYRESYLAAMDRIGGELLDGIDIDEFVKIMSAVDWGLLLYWLADPTMAEEEFVTTALTAIALSFLGRPDQPRRSIVDIEAAVVPFFTDDRPLDVDARRKVAVEARGLFADGAHHVAFSEIADAAGTDAVTLRRSFGRPERVAAYSFAAHLDDIALAANAHLGRDPQRPVVDGLCTLIRAVREDPHAARELLHERLGDDRDEMIEAVALGQIFTDVGAAPGAEELVDAAITMALSQRRTAPAALATQLLLLGM